MEIKRYKWLNVALWLAQALLAAGLLWAAYMKLFSAPDDLAAMWPWTAESKYLLIGSAFVDILGGIGIILPSMAKTNNKLTIWAACGIIALMIIAAIFHISRGEASVIGVNIFFMLLASFVIWGRKRWPVI